MRTVRITYSDGDSTVTRINGTEEEIRQYYRIGNVNIHGYDDGNGWKEYKRTITGLEFIDSPGYYLTYNSGHGVFGYVGKYDSPFDLSKPAIVFATREEARVALKYVQDRYAIRAHYVANHLRIIPTTKSDHVKNKFSK